MSLTGQVAAGVTAAFAALGDLAQTVTVRRSTLGGYDANGSTVAETTTDHAFTGAVVERKAQVEGGVTTTALTLMLKPGPINPAAGDHVVIAGAVYRVTTVGPIQPGATVLAWQLEAVA